MNRSLISLIVALLLAAPALADTAAPAPAEGRTTYAAEDIRIQQYGDTAAVAFRLVGMARRGLTVHPRALIAP
jgi:hypothetical protein